MHGRHSGARRHAGCDLRPTDQDGSLGYAQATLQPACFRELRSIVAQSEPVENVAVVNLQPFSLLAASR
jgi:hypothetical protein